MTKMKKLILIVIMVIIAIYLLSLLFINAHQRDHNNSFKQNPPPDTIKINDTLYDIRRR